MEARSFLHPDHAYTISKAGTRQQESTLQAPDIFVVPPEEDQTPPWCCYNSQQGLANQGEEEYTLRYPEASSYTPFFHSDIEGLILPSRKGSSETRSIVDALGDADDFSDHEFHHDPVEMDPEEDEENDGILPETETNRGRTHRHQHFPQEFGAQLRSPRPEVDNDSDIIEVVKVRRKSVFNNDPNNHLWASGSVVSKSTLRSRATKAFQSIRGSLRTSSKTASQSKSSSGSLSNFRSHSSLGFRSKSQSRPRAQDVFSPIENIPQSELSHMPELRRRPSSRLSEFFGPALKRQASTALFTSSAYKSPAPILQSQESPIQSQQKSSSRPPDGSHTPRRRSSSSTHKQPTNTNTEQGDVPTPTRSHFQRRSEGDESTPSWRTSETRNTIHHDLPKSISPTPASRTKYPPPGSRQAKRGLSVLNIHKIFQKPAPKPFSDVLPQSMRQASGSSSTCPSLSSTPTSEWSGRTSPTTDSVPQTPTSFDENEVIRTIVPVGSSSTVGSGISLGLSLQGSAVSCLSSGSVSSEATAATPGHELNQLEDTSSGTRTVIREFPTNGSAPELSRPSMASSHSAVFTGTGGQKSESTISSPLEASSESPFDMALHLDLDLDLGLDINVASSPSGGMLSSNGMSKATASESTVRKTRGRANLSRSLSLKNLGNRLGIRKQDVPPVPPLPGQSSRNTDFEMRLDSLHFDDMSFDADRFIAH